MNKEEFLKISEDVKDGSITTQNINGVLTFLYSGRHRYSGKVFMILLLVSDDKDKYYEKTISFGNIREKDLDYFLEDYDSISFSYHDTVFKRKNNISRYNINDETLELETEEEKLKLEALKKELFTNFGSTNAAS